MLRSLGISEPAAARLEITRMRRRHLRGVMVIERQAYARPWSPNLFVAEMTEPNNRCYLVARMDREVVGYGGMICYGDEAHITNIAVDPERQRSGVATRLLFELTLQAIEMGGHAISLEVRVTNWGAQRLYGRFGYHPVGIRRNYYQELQEDALIMWTDDIRNPGYGRRLELIAAELPEGIRPA
ncbi:MAG: [ribosomal protein S18]-alanine N-acetyltransferase [Actinomycetota bacterium]|nr:[ribosomal protein S18]-alanine N-acetyltransferase [Actinomycetota bacterium]